VLIATFTQRFFAR